LTGALVVILLAACAALSVTVVIAKAALGKAPKFAELPNKLGKIGNIGQPTKGK